MSVARSRGPALCLMAASLMMLSFWLGASTTSAQGSYELQVVDIVNLERAAAGLTPLATDVRLFEATELHAQWMADNNLLSHQGEGGSNAGQRAEAAGYIWSTWGEVLAAGQTTPDEVVRGRTCDSWCSSACMSGRCDGWKQSAGHWSLLMGSGYRDIGVGYVLDSDPGDPYHHWWASTVANSPYPATPVGQSPPSPTASDTPLPPTETDTPVPPTATDTAVPTATDTAVPPTATDTVVPPTATHTSVPATSTNTNVPPTATDTAVPPTATNTAVPTATDTAAPAATNTTIPPTATDTAVPPTATDTAVPPTATAPPAPTATNTAVPATATDPPAPTSTNTAVPPTSTLPAPTATPASSAGALIIGRVRVQTQSVWGDTTIFLDSEPRAITGDDGWFVIFGVTPGYHTVRTLHTSALASEGTFKIEPGEVNDVGETLLLLGDVYANNRIDLMDRLMIQASIGRCYGDSSYQPWIDVDGDGCILDADLAYVDNNFGRVGPTNWLPVP